MWLSKLQIIENFPIIFNNRIYVSIKSNRSISFNFSIILIFLKRLLINRKYNLTILEEFFFFLSLVSTVSKISYLFFSLGWKESTFRLSLPCRPRWCNGSAFALDHFSFFFFPFLPPPPPPLPIWSPGYTTHFLAPLSLSSTYFLRYPASPILSFFHSSIANNSPLPPLRAFMIRWGEKLPCLAAWNGTTLWLQGDREGEGRRVLSAIFLFFVISI